MDDRSHDESEPGRPFFRCSACGGHGLTVIHEYATLTTRLWYVPCACQDDRGDSSREVVERTRVREWGPLGEDHQWACEASGSSPAELVSDDSDVHCARCFGQGAGGDMYLTVETEIDEESTEYSVVCASCSREVEFGWSRPDRQGDIWPAECPDFDPSVVWPEPRFRELWAARGWE